MLIPQPQLVCQRCGIRPAGAMTVCSSCGAPIALPWPAQSAGPFPRVPFPLFAPVSQPNVTPLVIELALNFLGIYGVGWLLLGNLAVGLPLLTGSLICWLIVPLLTALTLGLGLLCLGPLALVAIPCNLVLLLQAIKRRSR